jgi:hypothetical protein
MTGAEHPATRTAGAGRRPRPCRLAVRQCRVGQDAGADRPGGAAAAGRGRAAEHPVPDLYQGRRGRDAEPPVQAAGRLGDAARCRCCAELAAGDRRGRPTASRLAQARRLFARRSRRRAGCGSRRSIPSARAPAPLPARGRGHPPPLPRWTTAPRRPAPRSSMPCRRPRSAPCRGSGRDLTGDDLDARWRPRWRKPGGFCGTPARGRCAGCRLACRPDTAREGAAGAGAFGPRRSDARILPLLRGAGKTDARRQPKGWPALDLRAPGLGTLPLLEGRPADRRSGRRTPPHFTAKIDKFPTKATRKADRPPPDGPRSRR